jgi:predicted DNA-binding ribbon-helix-helix protein
MLEGLKITFCLERCLFRLLAALATGNEIARANIITDLDNLKARLAVMAAARS